MAVLKHCILRHLLAEPPRNAVLHCCIVTDLLESIVQWLTCLAVGENNLVPGMPPGSCTPLDCASAPAELMRELPLTYSNDAACASTGLRSKSSKPRRAFAIFGPFSGRNPGYASGFVGWLQNYKPLESRQSEMESWNPQGNSRHSRPLPRYSPTIPLVVAGLM